MAKSFLGSLLKASAKAIDNSIKAQRKTQQRAIEQQRIRKASSTIAAYERERLRTEKILDRERKILEMRSNGYEYVTIKSIDKYKPVMDYKTIADITDAILKGDSHVYVHKNSLAEFKQKLKENNNKKKMLKQCANLNNKGIAYEKEGKIKQAISTYEKNIESEYPAHHAYKRLMILYHKDKEYDNELRVIKSALETFPNFDEYVKRYDKTILLLNQQKK